MTFITCSNGRSGGGQTYKVLSTNVFINYYE